METIKLHPTASPIVVVSPAEKEAAQAAIDAFTKAAKAITKAFKVLVQVVRRAWKAIKKALSFPVTVRLHPTAAPIEVTFLKALELGYFRE